MCIRDRPAAERSRRRFQLADRLARLYSQYLVYRADWLDAWASGIPHFATRNSSDAQWITTETRLLAPLWRHAVADIGTYRSQVVAELIATMQAADAPNTPLPALHVFGASHLAPAELAMLRAYARQALVALYPVSYAHLDVYKRQYLGNAPGGEDVGSKK